MKLSTAMIKGYAKVGKQCRGRSHLGKSTAPTAVCALGAAGFGERGNAVKWDPANADAFAVAVGVGISGLNDRGMCIEDIIGIAQAEGL